MTDVEIQPAAEEHLTALSQLAAVIWQVCYPGIISQEQINYMLSKMYSLETLRSELRRGNRYERLLADGHFIGFASFGSTDQPGVFKLHKLYLHPDWHGRGLGSRLLQHCEQEVIKAGARRLTLNVNKHNGHAITVYRKNGYEISDSVVVDIGNGFVMDDYCMAKNLSV